MIFSLMKDQFGKVLGPAAIAGLQAARSNPNHVIITIGGDQCTGKSTLSKRLAGVFEAQALSAGSFFRAEAARQGITVGTLSKNAILDPGIDVRIDYAVCDAIAHASAPVTIIEGRQPAVMAAFVKTLCTTRVIAIYLKCTFREQASRFIERECGVEVARIVNTNLPNREYESLLAVCAELRKLLSAHPDTLGGVEPVCRVLEDTMSRDSDDRARFVDLYGDHPELDNRSPSLYDFAVDTTPNTPQTTFDMTLAHLVLLGVLPPTPVAKL
jgi:cytidylate kinase